MRSSDWSSDVCSSDLVQADAVTDAPIPGRVVGEDQRHALLRIGQARQVRPAPRQLSDKIHASGHGAVADHIALAALAAPGQELGRASCRERVCQSVYLSVVRCTFKTKKNIILS